MKIMYLLIYKPTGLPVSIHKNLKLARQARRSTNEYKFYSIYEIVMGDMIT